MASSIYHYLFNFLSEIGLPFLGNVPGNSEEKLGVRIVGMNALFIVFSRIYNSKSQLLAKRGILFLWLGNDLLGD